VRLLAFAVAFVSLLAAQLVWQPDGTVRASSCRGCALERHASVKRPAVVHGRVRGGEANVCWMPPASH